MTGLRITMMTGRQPWLIWSRSLYSAVVAKVLYPCTLYCTASNACWFSAYRYCGVHCSILAFEYSIGCFCINEKTLVNIYVTWFWYSSPISWLRMDCCATNCTTTVVFWFSYPFANSFFICHRSVRDCKWRYAGRRGKCECYKKTDWRVWWGSFQMLHSWIATAVSHHKPIQQPNAKAQY